MNDERERYINLALALSAEMLKNGGETYRAEDCALRVLACGGWTDLQVTAIPTSVLVTASSDGRTVTRSRSVRVRSVDLEVIDRLISISRAVSSGEMEPDEAFEAIGRGSTPRPVWLLSLYSALSATLFTCLFGAGLTELLVALPIAFVSQICMRLIKKSVKYSFISSMLSSIFTAVCARCAAAFIPGLHIDSLIIGGIMPLLPGLSMTNAIRDTINGDLVSGSSRALESLLSAVAVAAGVGLVMAV